MLRSGSVVVVVGGTVVVVEVGMAPLVDGGAEVVTEAVVAVKRASTGANG
jgi:hypothetical protein